LVPKLVWEMPIKKVKDPALEPELALLPMLADRRKTAVDRASHGIYTHHLLAYSAGVIAFEPRAELAAKLAAYFRDVNAPVRVEAAALSDHTGTSWGSTGTH
jgi:hypothetical protein